MKFEVSDLSVKYELPVVNYNLESIKAQVELVKQEYKDYGVAESNLPYAKKLRGQLNKLQKNISRKRIDIKNVIQAPISEFDEAIKELEKEISGVSLDIDKQIKEYEEKEKEQKKQDILNHELWQDFMLFDEKWLNKTYEFKDIEKDMKQQATNFSNNSLSIATTCQSLKLNSGKYLDMLKANEPISEILQKINEDRELLNQYGSSQEKVEVKDNTEVVEETKDTTLMSYDLRVKGTITQLRALRQFIDDNGMSYEKL